MQFGPFNGIHRSLSHEAMPPNTVRAAWNCRIGPYGALEKRTGTQKIHDTKLSDGDETLGLYSWSDQNGIGSTILVGSEGSLYEMDYPNDTDFTLVGSGGEFDASTPLGFVEWDTGSERLVIIDQLKFSGGALRPFKYDGTTLTELTDAPAGARCAEVYKNRLWVAVGSDIYASAVNNPDEWAILQGALTSPVGRTDSTGITGIKAVGESLFIFKRNAVSFLRGSDPAGINIDADQEGLSDAVGCINPRTIVRYGQNVFWLSENGPYIANEGGHKYIGKPIEYWMQRLFFGAPFLQSHAAHHRGRREIHLWVTSGPNLDLHGRVGVRYSTTTGAAIRPSLGFIWNYEIDAWTGPWVPAGSDAASATRHIVASASFQRRLNDTSEPEIDSVLYAHTLLSGGTTENWILDADVPGGFTDLADRSTGANGSTYTPIIELPELLFGDSTRLKLFNPSQYLSADLDVTAEDTDAIQVRTYSEISPESTVDITVPTLDTPGWVGEFRDRVFRFSPSLRGKRPVMQVIFNNDGYASLKGVSLTAELGRRVI